MSLHASIIRYCNFIIIMLKESKIFAAYIELIIAIEKIKCIVSSAQTINYLFYAQIGLSESLT